MNHITIDKQKGYKNKIIAQKFGISIAQEIFNNAINNQIFSFNWNDNPINDSLISELRFCYSRVPNNYYILEDIAKKSCLIEYENLKVSYGKPLPIKEFTDDEIFSFILQSSTSEIVKKRKQNNFSSFILSGGEVNGNDLFSVFKNLYPKKELIKESEAAMDLYFSDIRVSNFLKEKIKKHVDDFWINFNINL